MGGWLDVTNAITDETVVVSSDWLVSIWITEDFSGIRWRRLRGEVARNAVQGDDTQGHLYELSSSPGKSTKSYTCVNG